MGFVAFPSFPAPALVSTLSHTRPSALVIVAAGINCDQELVHAFELAGAEVNTLHLNELVAEPTLMDRYDLIGLPGGFSFGDAVAAGRIAAAIMRRSLWGAFTRAIARQVPMIAPCNGFQIAVQMGLLPGPMGGGVKANAEANAEVWPVHPPRPSVALAGNASGVFIDRWCSMEVPAQTCCIWTRDLVYSPHNAMLPIAHGEGRFVAGDEELVHRLEERGMIAMRYAVDDNPNGSMGHVAGICDASGLVLGLMPHPERFTSWGQHPLRTRLPASLLESEIPLGLQMFNAAVAYAMKRRSLAAAVERGVSAGSM